MAKPLFVLADEDADYIRPLEIKLIKTFRDSIELEVIDDFGYLARFLSQSRRVDVLIIAEQWFDQTAWSEVGIVYKLTEEASSVEYESTLVKTIFKYSNIQKIFGEIEYGARQFVSQTPKRADQTKAVVVYSASGGNGKTTIALGLCMSLVNNHKKALYIDAENLQDFSFYLADRKPLPMQGAAVLSTGKELYTGLLPYIKCEEFNYLPPLKMVASSMDIHMSSYRQFAEECKKHGAYDYIVIDTDAVFGGEKDELIQMADRVVLVTKTDEYSQFKTELLIKNFAETDDHKYITVCNMVPIVDSEQVEAYKGKMADVVIHEIQDAICLDILRRNKEIEQLSYLL